VSLLLRLCGFASWRYNWGVYVLVDNKATTEWHPVFEAQMLTYLRVTGLKLGLVINFWERIVTAGLRVWSMACRRNFESKRPDLTQRREDAKDAKRESGRGSPKAMGGSHQAAEAR